jgi:Uma2 family endonuclease
MSAIRKPRKLTEEQYLAIEAGAEFKSEFYDGETFAMAGVNLPHIRITRNLSAEIELRLKGGPCESFSSEMRVKVKATGLHTYPDIVIVCGEPEIERRSGLDTLLNPKVIIEIASKSTEGYDRGPKFKQYKRLPSVKEYVIVSSDRISVDRFVRQANGKWLLTTFDKPTGKMILETVPGVRIPLADVYRGVEFPESPGP